MVPEGYQALFRASPYVELIGPLYSRGQGAALRIALRAERKHCNQRGTVHGGILATLADIALGYAMAFATTAPSNLVAFGNCYITKDGERIVRASAVFLVAGTLAET